MRNYALPSDYTPPPCIYEWVARRSPRPTTRCQKGGGWHNLCYALCIWRHNDQARRQHVGYYFSAHTTKQQPNGKTIGEATLKNQVRMQTPPTYLVTQLHFSTFWTRASSSLPSEVTSKTILHVSRARFVLHIGARMASKIAWSPSNAMTLWPLCLYVQMDTLAIDVAF